jgi:hypothetical protein
MRKSTIDFDTVRKIALELPGVEDGTAYGVPALKVRGKLLACVPANRSAEQVPSPFAWLSLTASSCSPRNRMSIT